MDLYIYTDESGVFDSAHNDIFVFGGIAFLSFEGKENFSRKYLHAEQTIRNSGRYKKIGELKATSITPKDRAKLYRSTNQCYRFAVIIKEKELNKTFSDKKSKQRFLDFALKLGLKDLLTRLIRDEIIDCSQVEYIFLFCDQHTTATNGVYELRESILQEFKFGMGPRYYFHPPLFPNIKDVNVKYCDSRYETLIRSADIIANRVLFVSCNQSEDTKVIESLDSVTFIPGNRHDL